MGRVQLTWETFIQTLRDTGLPTLADHIHTAELLSVDLNREEKTFHETFEFYNCLSKVSGHHERSLAHVVITLSICPKL